MTSCWQKHFNQLKESFLLAATRKIEGRLRKTEQTWKKKITLMKVPSLKMRNKIQTL